MPRLVAVDSEFDSALIGEAKDLAAKLAVQSTVTPNSQAARSAKLLRDQLLVLLMNRVSQIRSAAKYVFPKHPDIVRKVTSAYERRRRAELRAKETASGNVEE